MAKAKQQIDLNSLEGLQGARQIIPWIQTYLDIYEKMIEINNVMQTHSDQYDKSSGLETVETFTKRHQQFFVPTTRLLIDGIALIPGFKELALDDQLLLTQNNLMSLILTITCRTYDPVTKSMRIGSMCPAEQLMVTVVLPAIEEGLLACRHAGECIYNLHLDAAESGMLWCLVALHTYGSDLIQQTTLEARRENITSHLNEYSLIKTGGMERALEILLVLPDIAIAGEMGKRNIQGVFSRRPHLYADPLFRDTLLVNVLRARSPSPVGET